MNTLNTPDTPTAICVYGASSSKIDDVYKTAAHSLGTLIGTSGHPLVSGGGRGGLMAEAIEGALEAGGEAIGVLPGFMVERQWQHPHLTRMVVTDSMHSRKHTMASLSQAAIAMPGGVGTLEELMEIITWRQLSLFKGNVVILNTEGYYDPLLQMLAGAAHKGFMRPASGRLFSVASTPEQALEQALKNKA